MSEATVFAYFGSKKQLFLEVLRRWYDVISSDLERDLPRVVGVRARVHFVVGRHLHHLIGDGPGLCALVRGEGRVIDAEFASEIAQLKRYTAPRTQSLEAAQQSGELRSDMPVRLMRDVIYGSMEHVLWSYVASGRKPDLAATSLQLTEVFMCGFAVRSAELAALQRFQADVKAALSTLEHEASDRQSKVTPSPSSPPWKMPSSPMKPPKPRQSAAIRRLLWSFGKICPSGKSSTSQRS